MALPAGTRLGPYDVLGPLGAGGMGEVYRARDEKLGREVALKILPGSFANDAERLARFRREAQVLAALSHPNIAAIYGLENAPEQAGAHALVFALIKGHEANIPQEAIIGVTYAVTSAAVILTMSKSTGEAEHLRDMLVGNILSVQWDEVWLTGAIYLAIGLFHFVFRHRFLDLSMHGGAAGRGASVMWWDFLFYASFGLVVTRSVAIAGVLLVFCYLIVPSVGAMLWARRQHRVHLRAHPGRHGRAAAARGRTPSVA